MIRIKILNRKRLTEANVTTMSQMYKVPLEFAQIMNDPEQWYVTDSKKEMDVARKHVDVFVHLIKIIAGAMIYGNDYTKAAKADFRKVELKDLISASAAEQYEPLYTDIIRVLMHKQASKAEFLKSLSINDIKQIIEKYKPEITKKASERFKEHTVLSLDDGSFWSQLPQEDWATCGTEMQHCGRPLAEDGKIYQLFDGDGKWHVTIEMRPNKEIIQIKGKQNKFPEEKYWEAVYAFIKKYNAKNKEKLTPSNFATPNYIVDEIKGRLEKIYKGWQNYPELQKKFDEIKKQDPDDRRIGPETYQEFRRFAGYIESVYEQIWDNNLDHLQQQIVADAGFKITELHHYDKTFYSIEKLS